MASLIKTALVPQQKYFPREGCTVHHLQLSKLYAFIVIKNLEQPDGAKKTKRTYLHRLLHLSPS